ncbi:MAG: flagellar biosynthesis regulator FlaF [Desulfobacterales bacterium]|nr:flagellar biosynthesis regulator FlaF [Desulfobacterales bacterium]
MQSKQLQAYQTVEKATLPPREIEAQVLTRAARKLKECQKGWDAGDRVLKLDEALKFNQRIWSIFQAEVGNPKNPLPTKLKINFLRLSAFVDKRIFEIIAHPAAEKLSILITINENIAAGLRDAT